MSCGNFNILIGGNITGGQQAGGANACISCIFAPDGIDGGGGAIGIGSGANILRSRAFIYARETGNSDARQLGNHRF